MAVYHGKSGKVDDGGVAVANIVAWTVESTADVVEASDFGDSAKVFAAGMYEWGGSFEGNGDPENTEQAAFFAALKAGTELSDIKFYIDGTHYFSGNIIMTAVNHNTGITDLLKVNCTFKGSGALSYS